MNSSWVGSGIGRARSVTNMTAPLSTVTSRRSCPSGPMWSRYFSAISAPSSAVRSWICCLGQQHRLDVPGIQLG